MARAPSPSRSALAWLLDACAWALPPFVLFLLVLAAWQAAVSVFKLQAFYMPGPALVARAAWENRAALAQATLTTGAAALTGFAGSLLGGFAIALAFSQSRIIRRSCFPYAIFLQTVPIVAIAPLIVTWFGYGFRSVAIVAFIIGLFPIITTGTAGLTAIDPALRELFEFHNATRWQLLWKLRLPLALPYFVSGARTSSGLSVIGAIVGEIFTGNTTTSFGLGYLVSQTAGNLKTAYLFAAVLASTLLGLLIFGAVTIAGEFLLRRWRLAGR